MLNLHLDLPLQYHQKLHDIDPINVMLMMMAIVMEKSKSSLVTVGMEAGIKIDQLIVIVMALVMLNTIRIMSPIQRERTNTKMSKRTPKMSTSRILMIHIHIETRTLIVMSTQRRKASTKRIIIPMVMIIMINKGTETTIQIQIKITRNWT